MSPTTLPAKARLTAESRAKEIRVEAGVSPLRSAKCRAATENPMPMSACPTIFCQALSPSERCLEIFSKSSRNPMSPSPTTRKSSRTPEARGVRSWVRLARVYPRTVEMMMTRPPIVGVPRLVKCPWGPSWRMNCPYSLAWR